MFQSHRWPLYALFLGCCALTFGADMLGGKDISPWGLYLVPVGIGSWLLGRRVGLLLAALCTCLVVIGPMFEGHHFESELGLVLSWVNRGACLFVVALLAATARRVSQLESLVTTLLRDG